MMRLPWFEYRAPRTLGEAARILAGEGANAALIAGGTDLLPNMKRRQMAPRMLVSVRQIPELRRNGSSLGASVTLSEIVRKPARIGPDHFPAVPYPAPLIVPPPWEGGDGKEVKRDDAAAVV